MRGHCPTCQKPCENLSLHISRSSDCEWPNLPTEWKRTLRGLLMGDGSIHNRQQKKPYMKIGMITPLYLQHLQNKMPWVWNTISVQGDTEKRKQKAIQKLDGVTPSSTIHTIYSMSTITHPFFSELSEWYTEEEKSFPDDLRLYPSTAKAWYCCDGGLSYATNGVVSFKFSNEEENNSWIQSLFERNGFEGRLDSDRLTLTRESTKSFLSWIGDAPPGFRYKWCHADRSAYNKLKRASTTTVPINKKRTVDPASR